MNSESKHERPTSKQIIAAITGVFVGINIFIVAIFISSSLLNSSSDIIPKNPEEMANLDKSESLMPCAKIASKDIRKRLYRYSDLVEPERLVHYEINNNYKFIQCRPEIDQTYITLCDQYTNFVSRNASRVQEGQNLWEIKYLEGVCHGNHMSKIVEKADSFKVRKSGNQSYLEVFPAGIAIPMHQITSIQRPRSFILNDSYYIMTLSLTDERSFTALYASQAQAKKVFDEITAIMSKQ